MPYRRKQDESLKHHENSKARGIGSSITELKETRYSLHPSFSIKRQVNGENLIVGLFPPRAIEIADPDRSLEMLLIKLSAPRSLSEILSIARKWNEGEGEAVISDLIHLGILQESTTLTTRLSRNNLYYQLAGINDADASRLLQKKSVCVIGVGGTGATVATLLSSSGIGNIKLADTDAVQEFQLSDSIVFKENDSGASKTHVCAMHLRERNARVSVATLDEALTLKTYSTYLEFVRGCDIIVLSGYSHPSIQVLTQSLGVYLGIPFLPVGCFEHVGMIGPLLSTEDESLFFREANSLAGKRAFLPDINPNFQAPSFGPLNTLVASVAANEVIRYLLRLPNSTKNQIVSIDSYTYETSFQKLG